MSSGVDARRRPNLWSYISFGTTPRRRSVSLPTRSNGGSEYYRKDSFAKHSKVDYPKEGAWMTPSQRSRYYKTGGIVAFVLFLLYLLSSQRAGTVGNLVPGKTLTSNRSSWLFGVLLIHFINRPWRSAGVGFCRWDDEVLEVLLLQ